MSDPVTPDPNPEQTALLARRVKRMMVIAGLTTALGMGAVLVAIGYRVFRNEPGAGSASITTTLPKGARIVSTAVAGDRIVVTLETGGATEIRTFDARTLRPAGRLNFASEP